MAVFEEVEKAAVKVSLTPITNSSVLTLDQAQTRPDTPTPSSPAPFQPPDGGLTAWLQVLAGFLLSSVAWGYPAMFGVLAALVLASVGLAANSGRR